MTQRTRALPIVALVGVTVALLLTFLYAPTDSTQGNTQRILYVHAPSAMIMYLAIVIVAASSILVLTRRHDWARWDRIASASAELGVVFLTIVLTTGPIWGRKAWGAWWVWDARLTSTLVLWLIFVGYLVFRALQPPGERRARLSAVIGVVGSIDIPVVHFAVTWWRTLHPGPVSPLPGGENLPGSMLLTLMVSLVAFTILFATLLVLRIRMAEMADRVDALESLQSLGPARV
jgi:heme exporter protein C